MTFEEASMLKDGEQLIYNYGLLKSLKFSNAMYAFGNGLPYFYSKGHEAMLSFYVCEQTEQQW